MIYATIDVELRDHERIHQAVADLPPEERAKMALTVTGLFTWSILYCRAKKLDGLFPVAVASCVYGGHVEDVIHRLLKVELWTLEGDAYRLRRYTEKNDTRERIEARIAATAVRKDRYRKGLKSKKSPHIAAGERGTRSTSVPLGVGVGVGVGVKSDHHEEDPEGQAGERPSGAIAAPSAPARASGAAGFAAEGFVEGCRSVNGGRVTLKPWERSDIEDLARDRPPDAEPFEWGRHEGETFARRQKESRPPMQVSANAYLAWVGDGRPPPLIRDAPRRPALVQAVPEGGACWEVGGGAR